MLKRVAGESRHLVDIREVIDDARGLFIVMEYVDGPSLEQALAQLNEPMDQRQALRLMMQIANALDAIHRAGVIHRDLKPSNVLLTSDGEVKVCDFGLATLEAEQEAMQLGSARYMAPELFTDEPVDVRADIYSLGMIAYEMLAGRPAFEQAFRTILRDQRHQALRWMKWHTNSRAAAPPLHEINENVPEILSELVARLMAKDRDARIPSADVAVDAVRRHFMGKAAKAGIKKTGPQAPTTRPEGDPSVPSDQPTATLPSRGKAVPVLIGMSVFWVIVIAGLLWYFYVHKPAEAEQARRAQARQMYEEASDQLRDENWAGAKAGFTQLAERFGVQSELGRQSKARALVAEGRIAQNEADDLLAGGNFGGAQAAYEQARNLFREADDLGVLEPQNMQRLLREARNRAAFATEAAELDRLISEGEFAIARRKLRDLREVDLTKLEREKLGDLSNRLEGQENQLEIEAIARRADQLIADGKLDEALAALTEGLQQFAAATRLRHRKREVEQEINYQTSLKTGKAAEEAGDLDRAITAYSRANRIRPAELIQKRINRLKGEQEYQAGLRLLEQGRFGEAADRFTAALGFNPEHAAAKSRLEEMKVADQADSFIQAADRAFSAGDFQTAIKQYENAGELAGMSLVSDKLDRARLRYGTQQAQEAMARWDLETARQALDEAMRISPDDPLVNRLSEDLALRQQYQQYLAVGDEAREESRFGDAIAEYRKARDLIKGTDIDPEEVDRRLADTEYDSLIARARSAMQVQQWDIAKAFLITAGRKRDTEEVRKLLAEVDAHAQE